MRPVIFGFFLLLYFLVVTWTIPTGRKDTDFVVDEAMWQETVPPPGEVDRLLKEYWQNQELVKSIGSRYYQIVYPVQLHHHEKLGISTRDVGPMYPIRGYSDGTIPGYQTFWGAGRGGPQRSKARTPKHFHRTSLLIKAFNHKFRLDLELNTHLLAPNMIQRHFLPGGVETLAAQEIEQCYYHGTVKDYPGAVAAFNTCHGVSGVIHLGNETFVIHPFYGGDHSQKHPHVIFEVKPQQHKGCANSENMEWRKNMRRSKQGESGLTEDEEEDDGRHKRSAHNSASKEMNLFEFVLSFARFLSGTANKKNSKSDDSDDDDDDFDSKFDDNKIFQEYVLNNVFKGGIKFKRVKRDVREATKYVETAIVLDKAMYERRNGSTRSEVLHEAIQVANIVDLYFRTLNTRVSIVYIETWQGGNKINIDRTQDIGRTLINFNDYASRQMYKIDKDTSQLLTGEIFDGGEAGIATPETICTSKAVGVSVDINTYEPHIVAATMAHMIGHNIGLGHDDGRLNKGCYCRDWHGCLMNSKLVGLTNVQPYGFSECSKMDYNDALRVGHGICLMNKPNEFDLRRSCGNGVVDEGEMCDCGPIEECHKNDPCCDPITCKLTKESECSKGPCCDKCKLRPRGTVCRSATNECDLPEQCTGESEACPLDLHKKNGVPCSENTGYCFNGKCPTLDSQCEAIWGYGGIAADRKCFDQFNSKGSLNGHCGIDAKGQFIKCEPENARCGSLQCQLGSRDPIVAGVDDLSSRTIISIKGVEYECKSMSGKVQGKESIRNGGLVRDGTPCGDHLICVNQTCSSLYLHMDQTKCPSSTEHEECSGHGICTQINECYCEPGWTSYDCSEETEIIEPPTTTPSGNRTAKDDLRAMLESQMQKKVTPYGGNRNKLSTLTMVFILVGVVKGVFICFTLMAVCYRGQARNRLLNRLFLRVSCCPVGYFRYSLSSSLYSFVVHAEDFHSTNTGFLVGILMSVVGGVFVLFALMALCYSWSDGACGGEAEAPIPGPVRKTTMHKFEASYPKSPVVKKTSTASGPDDACVDSGEPSITIESMPSTSRGDTHRVVFRPEPRSRPGTSIRIIDRSKLRAGDDDPLGLEEDAVAVIEIPPSNLSKLPEKGILKKPYGERTETKDKWSEDSQSDNQEVLSQSDHHGEGPGAAMTEVERALKDLNGYHEDILDALRTATKHRGASGHLSDEIIRKALLDKRCPRVGSQEKVCDKREEDEEEEEELPPACGPIRIRNLEDLVRQQHFQLEHHSTAIRRSPGTGEIRKVETEIDRHYRLDATDPLISRPRTRPEDDPRFVYGKYRHPTASVIPHTMPISFPNIIPHTIPITVPHIIPPITVPISIPLTIHPTVPQTTALISTFTAPLTIHHTTPHTTALSSLHTAPHSSLHSAIHSAASSSLHAASSSLHAAPHSSLHTAIHSAASSSLHTAPHSSLHTAIHSAASSSLHTAPHSSLHGAIHSAAAQSSIHTAIHSSSAQSSLHTGIHTASHTTPHSALQPAPHSVIHSSAPTVSHPAQKHGRTYLPDEDIIYEANEREGAAASEETAESESGEFIQAQRPLVRSASAEVVHGLDGLDGNVGVHRPRAMETPTQNPPQPTVTAQYYQSPTSNSDSDDSPNDPPKLAPEYKH